MQDDVVVNAEGISKKFSKSLRKSMMYGIRDVCRNILGLRAKSSLLRSAEFWAVRDVSFELKKGEALGIIGANGSGKTTILKLLNGIFWPDRGRVSIRGRVGALIAVGAGFHPMLSGRENIKINAAILGMTRAETERNTDAIIEFADVGDFIDMPVKYYSSGMFVKLGFSVAVHCRPDVLLIDEILSVGDMSFQNKSLTKLAEIREKAEAVVFVSHNMDHVRNLCTRVIVMDRGAAVFEGAPDDAIVRYQQLTYDKKLASVEKELVDTDSSRRRSSDVLTAFNIIDENDKVTRQIPQNGPATFSITFRAAKEIINPRFSVAVRDERNINIIWHDNLDKGIYYKNLKPGQYNLRVVFERLPLTPGVFFPHIAISDAATGEVFEQVTSVKNAFKVASDDISRGIVYCESRWTLTKT